MIDPDDPRTRSGMLSAVLNTAQCTHCLYVYGPDDRSAALTETLCPSCRVADVREIWPFTLFKEKFLPQLQEWDLDRKKNAAMTVLFSAAIVESILRRVVMDALRKRGASYEKAVATVDNALGLHPLGAILAKTLGAESFETAIRSTPYAEVADKLDRLRKNRNKLAHGASPYVKAEDARDAFACVLNFNGMMRELLNRVPRQAAAGAKERGHGG